MVLTYLGLGSNVEPRIDHLRLAVHELKSIMDNMTVSCIYESPAMLPENAPSSWDAPFYNCVIAGDASLSPDDLFQHCQQIEQSAGRERQREKWSPRQLDVDILDMENGLPKSDTLHLPHPGIAKRPFVFLPLQDVAPEYIVMTSSGPTPIEILVAEYHKSVPTSLSKLNESLL